MAAASAPPPSSQLFVWYHNVGVHYNITFIFHNVKNILKMNVE